MERNFETVMIEQCAPVLASLKPAGLFRYETRDCADLARRVKDWNTQLNPKGLRVRVLKGCVLNHRYLVYVYRESKLAAVLAEGTTILENVAREPHIVDLANFLNMMGADVHGAGTDVIKIHGVKKMHGCNYSIIPDQIEAGSYMVGAAITGGDVTLHNVIPKHMEPITAKLRAAGCEVTEYDDAMRIVRHGAIHPVKIKTMPHPGFPTDMQPLMTVLLTLADGTSIVTEGIWENRFRYVDELIRMGANIQVDGQVAVIEGVKKLYPAPLRALDLRAGAAMVMAALAADGVSVIDETAHIERGYENIVEKLQALGADIRRVEVPVRMTRAM